jgi:hypothetical protein
MAQVMAVVWILAGLLVAWPCLVIWFALAFPRPVSGAKGRLEHGPGRCFATGLVLYGVVGTLSIGLINNPNSAVKVVGFAITAGLVIVATVGGAGLVKLMGERVRPLSAPISPLAALVRGAALTEFAALFPFFGWFLFLPLATITCLGAGAIGLARGEQAAVQPVPLAARPPEAASVPPEAVPAGVDAAGY